MFVDGVHLVGPLTYTLPYDARCIKRPNDEKKFAADGAVQSQGLNLHISFTETPLLQEAGKNGC